jgi:hypothetical protein
MPGNGIVCPCRWRTALMAAHKIIDLAPGVKFAASTLNEQVPPP